MLEELGDTPLATPTISQRPASVNGGRQGILGRADEGPKRGHKSFFSSRVWLKKLPTAAPVAHSPATIPDS
jgi:hypothetical protein